jgi:hypothetical protein
MQMIELRAKLVTTICYKVKYQTVLRVNVRCFIIQNILT